jgi:hypothetical protein
MDWTPTTLPGRISLWRTKEMQDHMGSGGKIEGFHLDPAGKLRFQYPLSFDGLKPATLTAPAGETWHRLTLPIPINPEAGLQPRADVTTGLQFMVQMLTTEARAKLSEMETQMVFGVLRSTADAGFASEAFVAKDTLWIRNGVAAYVALKTVAGAVGPGETGETGKYYNPALIIAGKTQTDGRIDLLAWPVEPEARGVPESADLFQIMGAYASKVVADICAKHGDALLPKLLAEIGKTPPERVTMETVHRAFRRLTREDLRAYLPKPSARP